MKCQHCKKELKEIAAELDKANKEKAICLGVALRYKDALEEIAFTRKVESIGCGSQDNSCEIETARVALGLPKDLPEYDDPDYE